MANVIEFTRGDAVTHTFSMPTSAWSSGGHLRFMAKPVIDDDPTDAAAVISQEWTDTVVTDVVLNGVAYKQYACYFPPSATNSIVSNGAPSANYQGEFQWVNASNIPVTFPATSPKLNCIVYFDVIREIT
jgi:hypothetical protein